MKRLLVLLVVSLIVSCQKSSPEVVSKPDSVKVPSLLGSGTVTYKYKNLTPFLWAYCLDMVKNTNQEKDTLDAFSKACDETPTLLEEVMHHNEVHAMIKDRMRMVQKRR